MDEVYLDYVRVNCGLESSSLAGMATHVVSTDSLTNVYGLGPIRAGWLVADPQLLEQARQVVDLLHVNHPVVSGRLAVRAFGVMDELQERSRQVHGASYPIFASWLASRPDVRGYPHCGALFAWMCLGEGCSARGLTQKLSEQYETNVVSGHFFGDDGHIRVGLGVTPEVLAEGLARVGEALDAL